MVFEGKQLSDIVLADVQALIDNQVREQKTVEYKGELEVAKESQKKEFLADVSSFANASGGHLLYGVRAKDGVPTEITGAEINPDQITLQLQDILRNGLDPRIPGLDIQAIEAGKSKHVLIIRVPKSWAVPHMITFQQWSRFYSRSSNGKYPLDVAEIRAAFLASEALAERIRRFRAERLAAIVAGETPVSLGEGAKIVLHIVPIRAFDPANTLSASALEGQLQQLRPIAHATDGSRYNLDGFVTFDRGSTSSPTDSYVQLFRSGCLEAVDTYLLERRGAVRGYSTDKLIPSIRFERDICQALVRYLEALRNLGVEPPLFVMLSLIEVSGYVMTVGNSFPEERVPIDRDTLILPEILLEDYGAEPARVMRPAFDAVWNACGWPGSINYDKSGK